MDQLDAHRRAQAVFASVLAQVTPDQLGAPSPCDGWDVRAVIAHVIQGNTLVVTRAGGEAPAVPDDLVEAHAVSSAAAHDAFAAADGLTRMFDLPIGSVPGSVFITLRSGDALAHAWDVARATGQPTDLDPELAAVLLEGARGLMTPALRGPGRPFAEEQPSHDGATAADRFAAFLGRSVT